MATVKSYNKRLESLRSERSTFMSHWRELSDYHLAYRGRFLVSDRNKGHKRNTKQINNSSRLAVRTLASGMMAGITSPARPWFRLGPSDPELKESSDVKQWHADVQTMMYRVFSASNTYNSLHALYSEMGVFGTGAMGVFQDFDNVIRCKTYTVGSYFIALNGVDEVDSFYREYEESVAQVVKQFGLENCSNAVKSQWSKGNTEAWVKLVHAVEPNDNRDMQSPMASDMPTRSVYYEFDTGDKLNDKFLRQSGFNDFPILAPRWDVTGEDVYATDCPGMTALGDTKALQLGERRRYQMIDKITNPPLQGPASLRNKINGRNVGADDIVWTDGPNDKLSSIYDFRPDIGAIQLLNQETENRIQRAFYEDLFLMLANTDRRQITAREVAEKHEEKLLMLGPVLERLHTELLDPLINRTFNILQESGVLPPPPPEMEGKEMNVEYISVLAQAQRLVATGSIERLADFAGNMSAVWPEARHKVDALQALDEYAEALGVDPKIIRSDDHVAQIVEGERQAAAQQAALEQGQQLAETAQTASNADTGGDNALTNMMRNAGLQ